MAIKLLTPWFVHDAGTILELKPMDEASLVRAGAAEFLLPEPAPLPMGLVASAVAISSVEPAPAPEDEDEKSKAAPVQKPAKAPVTK